MPARPCSSLWSLLLAAALPMTIVPASGHAEGYFYSYFKERIPLQLDPHRVAVFREADTAGVAGAPRGDAPLALGMSLMQHGYDPTAVRAMEVRGWSWAGLPGALRAGLAAEDVERAVATLAADPVLDFVSPVLTNEYGPVVVTRDILVGLAAGVSRERAERALAEAGAAAAGAEIERDVQGIPNVWRVRSASRNGFETLAMANALAAKPEFAYAEPDMIMTVVKDLIPNDPLFVQQWGLRNTAFPGFDVGATTAWDTTTGAPSVVVAVIDDGVQLNHPDLNLAPGIDFTGQGTNGGPASACDRHGTTVAGCVSAIINNNTGVVGVAPTSRVAPVKFNISQQPCNGSGTFQITWMSGAISWAQNSGARVTNNSNSFGQSSTIDAAYTNAYNAGVVHFASAGNSGAGSISYPSSSPNVNSVAAMAINGTRASFSQFGAGLDFIAPGQSIVTTDRTGSDGFVNGDYATVDGTSYASPIAAGVAALVVSQFPSFTAAQIENQLQQTATRLGAGPYPNTDFGWGLLRADRAIQQLCAPNVGQQPANVTVASGGSASFTVSAASGQAPFTYTWFRNNVQVNNGGAYSGATTTTLTINPASAAVAGTYFCRISNTCGSANSNTATLTIGCPGDANGDNQVNFQDLNIVLGQFGQSGVGLAGDVNGDGVVNFIDLNIVLSNFGRIC